MRGRRGVGERRGRGWEERGRGTKGERGRRMQLRKVHDM